jgi:IclR family pca regulon transcriptional regulator
MEDDIKPGGQFVQGLARGLAVIRAFDGGAAQMTLADISKACDLNRAAVRRSLLTLQTLGYVRGDGRRFSLTPKILDLGFSFLTSQGIGARVQPLLRQVSEEIGETVALGMLEGTGMVCVAHAPGAQRVLTVGLTVGSRMPLLATAIGRAYLAFSPEEERERLIAGAPKTRLTPRTFTDPARLAAAVAQAGKQGYALVDEEFELGVRAIAVPVLDAQGRSIAALNVVVSTARTPVSALTDIVRPALARAAVHIAEAMA